MKTKLVVFTVIPLVLVLALFCLQETPAPLDFAEYSVKDEALVYGAIEANERPMSKEDLEDLEACFLSPNLDKSFVGFKEAVAFKESRGDYFSVNTFGYLGKYQFAKGTLKLIGIYNAHEFLNNPELQEKAFLANAARNKWILRRDIKRFVGKTIGGVKVTESGILAAAHLAGPGSVKRYLRSFGAIGFTDGYGTTIRSYMNKFSGFDTSFVTPDRKAKATVI